MERLLSIIIPVYNVEPYIPRCLDSIYSQNVDEDQYELVIVNDGSQDDSSAVVKKFQLKHSNIVLIEKENGGVSSARNLAIKNSKGRHLIFVDPDDALMKDSLSTLISFLSSNQNNPVVVMRSFNNEQIECYKWTDIFNNYSSINSLEAINKGYVRGSVCGCSFLKDFVVRNNILFPEGIKNSEDTIFFFHCISICGEVVFNDIKFYNIIGRGESASRVFSMSRVDSALESVKYVDNMISKKDTPILNFLKYNLISNLVYTCIKTKGTSCQYIRSQNKNHIFKVNTAGLEYKTINMILLNLSFCLYYLLNRILFR